MSNSPRHDDLARRDVANILHPATSITQLEDQGPRIIESGQGIRVTDSFGHQVIDAIAGLWCVNLGYGRDELAKAMADAARNLGYYHSFAGNSNPDLIDLAEQLMAMAPDSLGRVFFGSSGSDANDTLIKIVWQYNNLRDRPEKKKIIARTGAYHGTSLASASLTGLASFHKAFDLPIKNILHTEFPHYYRNRNEGESERDFSKRMAQALEDMIEAEGPDTVAAFIAEPIMGAGGVVPPPEGYFDEIQAVLARHDILMIADEVICGYGRLGVNFGSDAYHIKPDMMASAKGITSGYFPFSAAYVSEEIWEVLRYGSEKLGYFAHGYTYSGHPVGAAVALKTLEIIKRDNLIANAGEVGGYLIDRLTETFAESPHVGEVRGMGLLAGVQLMADKDDRRFFSVADKIPARVTEQCYRNGLIARPLPTVTTIAFSPPLILTKAEADQIVSIFAASLDEIMAGLSDKELAGTG